MCLNAIHPEQLTASKEIPVYKVIRFNNKSQYRGFVYKPNTLYRLRQKLRKNKDFEINEGFHSFESKVIAFITGTKNSYVFGKLKVVEFYIPKGAKYYCGDHADIVSSSIRSGDLTPC